MHSNKSLQDPEPHFPHLEMGPIPEGWKNYVECTGPAPRLAASQATISGRGCYHHRSELPFPLPMSLAVSLVVSNAAQLLVKKGSLPPHTLGLARAKANANMCVLGEEDPEERGVKNQTQK